ncbi:phosphomannomutase [Candidatus Mycoplasma haematobovis]|uniref:Phosphomannomutase n=1 Tax=Candidatus Mycoplasma haematobovis TaxID=432608 RepID=A0A1A9QEX6_9MOLU|nr:phosphomannomutase [Candidatus Mycoplasma haematobovis]OAL10259.1 phosphomannomutase [Candidatus Mycoplasma haematobovis]
MKTSREIYEEWKNSSILTDTEKEELERCSEEEIEKYFSYEPFKFSTAGIRRETGIAPQKLNKYSYRLLAVGYAKYLKSKSESPSAIVGHDNRENGIYYSVIVASVLRNFNIKVYLTPHNVHIPTPVLSYYIRKLGLTGGINISASHNPPNYNGFKTYNYSGCQTNIQEEEIIKNNIPCISNIFKLDLEDRSDFEYLPESFMVDYFKEIITKLPHVGEYLNHKTKVLFSSHHGTSSYHMLKLANMLGFENFMEYAPECNVTYKLNKGEIANPEEKESFKAMIEYANENDINYVCAHDPDGDRVAIVEKQKDGSWYYFNGNEIGVILAYFKLSTTKFDNPYIVSTNVTSDFISRIFPEVPVYTTLTGFKNISKIVEEKQQEGKDLIIAFEEAIGILLLPDFREKDGYQQLAYILRILASLKQGGLKDVLDYLRTKYGYWKAFTEFYRVNNHEEYIKVFSETKVSEICSYECENIELKDEILAWYFKKGGWIKFRASGTEPKFKIYYNLYGENEEWVNGQINKLKKYFKNIFKI